MRHDLQTMKLRLKALECNDRVTVLARSASPIPGSLVMTGGLDFLLRQAVVVACTSLEAFFWDALRENALTVVQARRTGADETLKNIPLTLGDYMSISQYDDPDFRLRQLILKNFARGTLRAVACAGAWGEQRMLFDGTRDHS